MNQKNSDLYPISMVYNRTFLACTVYKSFKGHMKDDAFSASATASVFLTSSAQLGDTF